MPIFTTYLGFLNKHGGAIKVAMKLGSCFVYYVARKRGNDAVAPTEYTLRTFMALKKTHTTPKEQEDLWKQCEEAYHNRIRLDEQSIAWMEHRAQEARIGNILLVCYEKDARHCHRRLLAEEIARRFSVEYKGEVEEPAHIYSLDGKPDKFDYQ